MEKIKINKERILHGDEKEIFYSSFTINLEGTTIEINGRDFYDKPLRSLISKVSEEEFKEIAQSFIVKTSIVETYFDKDSGLPIYYYSNGTYLFLFSFGELNPNHFVVDLVEVWKN